MLAQAKKLDSFPYEIVDVAQQVSSPCSWLGTLLAVAITTFASWEQLVMFSAHTSFISRSTSPRQPDLRVDTNRFWLMVFRNGKPYHNQSIFRWKFTYRSIFHGDAKNDVHPRQYHTLPSKSCQVYFDLDRGTDPWPYDSVLYPTETKTGKEAEMGCVDWLAARDILREKAADGAYDLRQHVQMQGRYGEASYWFLEANLAHCSNYGAAENITCSTHDEEAEILKGGFTIDAVFLDNLSPGVWKWSNIFYNLDPDTWVGQELFFRGIRFTEHHKHFPSVFRPTESVHSVWDSVMTRSAPRSTSFAKLYFRLASTRENVEVVYFSLETAFEGIGAWHGFVFLIMGMLCVNYNRISHNVKSCRGVILRESSNNAPKQVDKVHGLMPVDDSVPDEELLHI
eukprot:TRINITY_DN49562_c0_g1_i1.p1 TRINITY_DN49562_c0_g1~~TRINITY_DN49562_c0_g1_i1.p1  ORF type:complete len:397 (-),score=25.29 TRINITY_DN49562_c0_g1_i1:63-1253(-)